MPIHYSEGEFPLDTYCGHLLSNFKILIIYLMSIIVIAVSHVISIML